MNISNQSEWKSQKLRNDHHRGKDDDEEETI